MRTILIRVSATPTSPTALTSPTSYAALLSHPAVLLGDFIQPSSRTPRLSIILPRRFCSAVLPYS